MANIQIVGIYKITSPSGRVYIGQSWNITTRWRHHRMKEQRYKNTPLQLSITKYGLSAHKFEIIYVLPKDVEQYVLDSYEQFYMDQYRKAGIKLLNIKEGGSNGKMAESSKRLLSIVKSNPSEETRRKMREGSKRRIRQPHSEETKRKMSIKSRFKNWNTKGENHPQRKLTNADVLQIRSMASTIPQTEIAKKYSISTQSVSSIILRTNWRHI